MSDNWNKGLHLAEGHILHGPDGMGYVLTRRFEPYDGITEDLFEPFGGAPDFMVVVSPNGKSWEYHPEWLGEVFRADLYKGKATTDD